MSEALELWERAKALKAKITAENANFFSKFQNRYPSRYSTLASLTKAYKKHELTGEVLSFVTDFFTEREKLQMEMNDARVKSDLLFAEIRNSDKRILLNPLTDGTPTGEFPKLKQCAKYPLRQDCNFGSNSNCKWERCEFMKYDNSKSIYDNSRWICTSGE